MVVSGLVLLGVSWIYSLIIMILLISIALPILFYLRKMKDKTEVFSSARSAVSGQIVDTLSNISVVKSFANEGYEMRAHEEVSEREMKAWHKMLRVYLMLDNWRRIALVLFGVAMMAACLLGWQYGLITIGEIATIMGLAFSFTSYAWAISFGIIHTSQSFGYLSDTLKTIAVPIDLKDHTTSEKLNVTSGEINISNLTFKYTDKDVLENLSLHIKSGERIGLVGISGAGKSTLISKMIPEFRKENLSVVVLAIDPSSEDSHGALLGDRIRMRDSYNDPGVFIRSLATRGAPNALTVALPYIIQASVGFADIVIVETAGAGQVDVGIHKLVNRFVAVLAPLGDAITLMKSGQTEHADIIAVNMRRGLPENDRFTEQARVILGSNSVDGKSTRSVFALDAKNGEGIASFVKEGILNSK